MVSLLFQDPQTRSFCRHIAPSRKTSRGSTALHGSGRLLQILLRDHPTYDVRVSSRQCGTRYSHRLEVMYVFRRRKQDQHVIALSAQITETRRSFESLKVQPASTITISKAINIVNSHCPKSFQDRYESLIKLGTAVTNIY